MVSSSGGVIGGFVRGNYWSSTENDANHSWYQDFSDGSQCDDGKDNTNYVRPVRRLSL